MIVEVWSGGQSGADIAGWRAAKAAGIRVDGYMPLGYLTEDGPRPEYATLYGAREMPTDKYPPRTEANIAASDGTILFGDDTSDGAMLAIRICDRLGKPYLIVREGETTPKQVNKWIRENGVAKLNVAGNRASKAPDGFGGRVETFLGRVFRINTGDAPR